MSPEQAAQINARPEARYFIIVLSVGRLRELGVEVRPTPESGGGSAGHASLANLSAAHYASDKDAVRSLAERIVAEPDWKVDGPFGPFRFEEE